MDGPLSRGARWAIVQNNRKPWRFQANCGHVKHSLKRPSWPGAPCRASFVPGGMTTSSSSNGSRSSAYLAALAHRVLVYDGAMGTNIQGYHLTPDDFGGRALEG